MSEQPTGDNGAMNEFAQRRESTPATETSHRTVRSEEILRGWKELIIVHGTEEYRLRVTRNGKLILTK